MRVKRNTTTFDKLWYWSFFFNGWGEFLNCYAVILHFWLKVSERFYIHVSSETTTPPADEVVEILAEVAKFLIEKEKENRCNWQPLWIYASSSTVQKKNDFVEVAKFKFQKLNQVHTLVIVNSKNKIDNDNTPLHLWF